MLFFLSPKPDTYLLHQINMNVVILSGSLSVNVSVTSGKDEFVNAGQLSVCSSSKDMLFKTLLIGILTLVMHAMVLMEFQFL